MFPGLTPADCQVAAFRHDQLVREGQRQQEQRAARVSGDATRAAAAATSPRLGFGQMLRRAGLGLTRGRAGASVATPRRAAA